MLFRSRIINTETEKAEGHMNVCDRQIHNEFVNQANRIFRGSSFVLQT
jgi:hypothetical protein